MPSRLSIAAKPKVTEPDPIKVNLVEFPAPVRVKNPAAVALGKLGGSKGGKKRAENLTTEQKKAIAKKGAEARWAKTKTRMI
ncbi:MAG TPA: hypothetical protein VH088_07820 [Terriglobales bacterium]|nr:hypothetical protein [Terriglobales bacterium]